MRIIKYLSLEYVLVFLIICFFVGVSIFPTFYHLWKTPPGTQFSLAYNFFPDYYQFISWMKDGANGHLDLSSRFTTEAFPRRYAHIFFPLLGFLGSRTGFDLFTTFTLSRIFLGIFRAVVQYILISLIIKDYRRRIIAFFISLMFSGFWYVSFMEGKVVPHIFLYDITNFDVLRRITFLPHHLLSNILVILFFIFLAKALEKDNKRYSLTAGLLVFGAALANPATILYMTAILALALVLLLVKDFADVGKILVHFGLVGFFILGASVYYKYYVFTVFPWNSFYQGELSGTRTWGFGDYLGALGVALPLSLIGFWGKKPADKILYIFLIGWAFGPILAFIILKNLFHSYIFLFRLFQSQQFVPLGILGSLGIFHIYEKFKSRIILVFIIFIIGLVSLPYYYFSIQSQLGEIAGYNYFVYLPSDTIRAFKFLDTKTEPESVVFAGFYMGQLLPAYTHNRVYLGKEDGTFNYADKVKKLTKFFSGQVDTFETLDIFKSGKVRYLLFGPDTPKPSATIIPKLTNVHLIYQAGENYIYQVNY